MFTCKKKKLLYGAQVGGIREDKMRWKLKSSHLKLFGWMDMEKDLAC